MWRGQEKYCSFRAKNFEYTLDFYSKRAYTIPRKLKTSKKEVIKLLLPVIEAERIKRGLTKDELARILGVSKRTIQNWQNGTTQMPLSKIILLTRIWRCSADYLLAVGTETTALNPDQDSA